MSKKAKARPDEIWLMGSEGADIINLGRLETVVRGAQLGDAPKRELIDLIGYVRTQEARKNEATRRGPKIDQHLRLCVVIVGALIEKHGIKKEAAVSAMVREGAGTEEERRKRRSAIYRAHTALNATGKKFYAPERLVNAALDRLDPSRNRK